MKTKKISLATMALALLLIIFTVSFASAQGGLPPRDASAPEAVEARSNYIPIQGKLTNSSGSPLNGNYDLTFRLYDVSTGGTALCSDMRPVTVTDGLFFTYMSAISCSIDGRQLYLSIEVGDDGEMVPRQYIDNVPYAWSLRPGAEINGALDDAMVSANNTGNGEGLRGTGLNGPGVFGGGWASPGVEGYSLTGPGVYAESLSGVAIAANGIITSTEPTYLWISGNGVRPYHQSDTTIIDLDSIGGAMVYPGTTVSNKNVMLPITIPGTLYGQNVRLTDLDLYWKGATDLDGITTILMRRQTGLCNNPACYVNILYDTTDYVCDNANHPTGCTQHFDLTTNNVSTTSSGVVYLTLELAYSGSTTWVEIGGVRLTLEYDD